MLGWRGGQPVTSTAARGTKRRLPSKEYALTLTESLRERHRDLWAAMTGHVFVRELGAGTLTPERFQRYFQQDYVFLRDFCSLVALAIAKAPSFDAARRLGVFLAEVLQGEEGLFRRAFREWGLPLEEMPKGSPAATALGNLMTRVAYEGSYVELLTVLVVTELTYLEWALALTARGPGPSDAVQREWIAIHASEEFRTFVLWLVRSLDEAPLTAATRLRVEELFYQTLRCEVAFWEAAYDGDA